MNSFYSTDTLRQIGFKEIGNKVLISIKASIYGAENITIGNNVRIDDFCILSGKIKIGNNIHIAAFSALYGGSVGITVDDFSNISSRVCIYAISDDYSGETMTNPTIPDKYKNVLKEPVHINRHVILGSGCTVLPGIILAEGSSFGAMTLINKNSEPWSINVGIPFRKIKERSNHLLELEKMFLLEQNENE
ncbi:MAG: galactoside O-acetyltransferase [Clostridiales bacterium GWF2_38_85]|nr:MAG: galactoside O-acetyltransferase [Clostridiales bacterium GWF2_38_85]HBL84310.1 galactoside O-acetyltransferase [Clostridiales bacterium]